MAAYAYVRDPHRQIDPFGLSGTCPLAGARQSNPWNEFQQRANASGAQFKNSKDAAKAYRHFQNGEYKEMAELIDLSSPHGKAVFWSGDLAEAQRYATKVGGTTMEGTPGGSIFNDWKHLDNKFEYDMWGKGGTKDAQPLWKALSERYANQATGPVTVVRNKVGQMWTNVEYKALAKGTKITYIETVPLPRP